MTTVPPATRAPTDPSDAAVIVASRDDPERFSEIFDRYFGEIHRYIASRLGDAPADDVAAETFLTAFTLRHKYDHAAHPRARAWLYGIATNHLRHHRRTETRAYRTLGRATAETDDEGHADRVAEMVSAQRMGPRLATTLASLRPGDRDVLLLVAYGDMSYEEVAQALGIRAGTVGSRLTRARRKLRTALELEGDME
jgi:RNA polymerase sigma-70 factor (ECF subfamily)